MSEKILTEIMELIEKNTDMPRLQKDIENWKEENKEKITIYEIYKLVSQARDL